MDELAKERYDLGSGKDPRDPGEKTVAESYLDFLKNSRISRRDDLPARPGGSREMKKLSLKSCAWKIRSAIRIFC